MRTLDPVEHGKLKVRGFQIGYKVFGDPQAPAVLLLPAWQIVHSRHWKMQIPYLSLFFRVITYDSAGNGGGERTCDVRAFEFDRVTDQGADLLDHLDIEQANVVGFSRGGSYGLWLAARYPERVTRLCLINPSLPKQVSLRGVTFWRKQKTYQGWEKTNAYYWREDYRGWLEFFFSQFFIEPHSTKAIDDCIGYGLAITPEILIATMRNPKLMPKMSINEVLERIRCPVRLIYSQDDQIVSAQNSRNLIKHRPEWESITLAGSGHGPHMRDPVKINLLLREFLIRS